MKPNNRSAFNRHADRGIALVTALLLLSLFLVLTLSMVIATMSDTLIDGYYRNARASFYGADSGLNAVRQALINDVLNNDLPSTYAPASGAPNLSLPTNAFPSDITSAFGSYKSILGSSSSSSSSSWPGTFQLDTTHSTLGMTSATSNNALCNPGSTTAITIAISCTYNYNYHIIVQGQSRGGEVNQVEEYGIVPITITLTPHAGAPTPFSKWSTLFDQYAICSAPLVPGTFTGTMFSNQSWNWGAFSTNYVLNGSVGAVNANVGYMYNDGTCDQKSTTSDSHAGTTIAPKFNGGLSLSQTAVSLPTDTYSQEQAVLDGRGGSCAAGQTGCSNPAPTNATLAADLKTAGGTAWSSSASSGVFAPFTPGSGSNPGTLTLTGSPGAFGGLYVQGNVDQMTLTASTSGSGSSLHKLQVITIKQGTTTTTVTLDLTAQTTEIQDNHGNDSKAMAGLPMNMDASPSPTEGCMVYVTGNISSNPSANAPTGLSGPSSGAAIQDGSAVTITAGGTISITGNITYSTEPVSLDVSDTPVSPMPSNVLGIYTTGGNVQFQPPSNVSTMEVDASFATINGASGSQYGLQASWNNINTLNIVGGRVQNKALDGSSLGQRNIYFDQRFTSGFAPPWFPTTMLPTPPTDTASVVTPILPKRLSWVNSSAQ
jgi:Tfp pilus assembly protein PilX